MGTGQKGKSRCFPGEQRLPFWRPVKRLRVTAGPAWRIGLISQGILYLLRISGPSAWVVGGLPMPNRMRR